MSKIIFTHHVQNTKLGCCLFLFIFRLILNTRSSLQLRNNLPLSRLVWKKTINRVVCLFIWFFSILIDFTLSVLHQVNRTVRLGTCHSFLTFIFTLNVFLDTYFALDLFFVSSLFHVSLVEHIRSRLYLLTIYNYYGFSTMNSKTNKLCFQ